MPQWSSSSSTRRTASKAAPAAVRSTRAEGRGVVTRVGGEVGPRRRRPAATQREPHLARHVHEPVATGDEKPVGEQLLGGGRGRSGTYVGQRGSRASGSTLRVDVLEQGPRGRRDLGQPALHLLGRGVAGERPDPADARSGATREALRDARERAHPAGRLPGDGQVDKPFQRRRNGAGLGEDERGELVRGGLTRHHEGIKNSELEAVQPVERARQRGARGGAGREMRGVVRGGSGEIGTIAEQPGQALVRPGPELVRQRPVPVHRGEATPAAHDGRPESH